MKPYEKLGAFYLGRVVDPETGEVRADAPVLYDAKDLTTHGVCVGMTGSGKTGLCLSLIEEAAIDGIPVLAIDPKGDLGNLLLTFPELRPEDFAPWIDPAEALRKGRTPEAHAAATAELWRTGLADWDQDGARIQRLRDAAEFKIYTPGSNAGTPLTVLRSFDAPPPVIREDSELLAERVDAAVSGVLALLGIDADPLQSREHILLANLLRHEWERGKSLDLPGVLKGLQSPPFQRVGFFDLESFYPAKDRLALAMRLNNLLASPGFQSWMEGEPLDIPSLLHTPDGRPKVSVLSIAHLEESERMFFVTLLLNELIAWMRTQPGTSSLRTLFYMDEIFGYFPPNGNPPAKRPMLTLLKQARAFGVGCVLATQNPVDLDYKGLSNTGTWWIGRLQTERDKLRVLDGLEGASGGKAFDRAAMERTLAGLGSRRFLLHNVHEDRPVVFHTRWALSYLGGPMTRAQIRALTGPVERSATPEPPSVVSDPAPESPKPETAEPPMIPASVPVWYLPPERPGDLHAYLPGLLGTVRVHYVRTGRGVDEWKEIRFAVPLTRDGAVWEEMSELAASVTPVAEAPGAASYDPLPAAASSARSYASWEKEAKAVSYERFPMTLFACPAVKLESTPWETEAEFRARMRHAAREVRDAEVEALKQKYESKFNTLRDRIRRAEDRVERETSQHREQRLSTAVSFGTTLLGAFLGRKRVTSGTLSKAGTSMRRASRLSKEKEDIGRAEDNLEALTDRLIEMETDFERDLAALEASFEPEALELETLVVAPRKGDMRMSAFGLVWRPV